MAEEPIDKTGAGETEPEQEEQATEEKITMTKDEFTDTVNKIVSERLAKDRKAREKEYAEKEAERLKKEQMEKLQGEERLKAEYAQSIEKLQKERDELDRSLKIAKTEVALSSKGFDPAFAPVLIGSTEEETANNLANFEKMITAQVQKITKENLSKGAPPAPAGGKDIDPIKDAIMRGAGLKE